MAFSSSLRFHLQRSLARSRGIESSGQLKLAMMMNLGPSELGHLQMSTGGNCFLGDNTEVRHTKNKINFSSEFPRL